MNPKVDEFLNNTIRWKEELSALRNILLDCGLDEELKWRQPCYNYQGKNLFLIGGFKEYCVLSFFNGVLLEDRKNILQSPGENSQAVKIAKFTNYKEINDLEETLKAYIFEAIEAEKAGLKVQYKEKDKLVYPIELQNALNKNTNLKTAFEALTPGRQRAYIIYINGAKQSATRDSRIVKYTPRILKGFGFNDCVCGQSKRYPNCDGSHKFLDKKIEI